MKAELDKDRLARACRLLAERLQQLGAPPLRLAVCGGSALLALNLVNRTTRDMDIVALLDADGQIRAPVPLPAVLLQAARDIAPLCALDEQWLNNGPSSGEGGLFQMGLPAGFAARLHRRDYGPQLAIYFADRRDQIFFKIYAATDRGGRHLTDLEALQPTAAELESAARWAMSLDVSENFRVLLKTMLRQIGHDQVAEKL